MAKDETFADVLWDTGEAKLDSLAVKAEMNLEPCTRYYWKVIVTTDADEVLESDVQFFETAKRDEPWVGKWITCDSRMERHPIFSKRIIPRGKVKKPVSISADWGFMRHILRMERKPKQIF